MRCPLSCVGEDFAVRAAEQLTLAPQTVSQTRVTILAISTGGTVMLEEGPGPLGLSPMRGVVKVNQDTKIQDWRGRGHPGQ